MSSRAAVVAMDLRKSYGRPPSLSMVCPSSSLRPANSTALLGQVDSGPFTQMIPGGGIPSGRAAWVVLAWGLAAVALAWWSLAHRDP